MKEPAPETQGKMPVEIVQELLAIHTTRKEAVEKLRLKNSGEISAIIQQADQFISALMNELSNFGDGLPGNADRENAYQEMWKNTLPKIDSMNEAESLDTFQKLEDSLKKIYINILENKTDLPASLQEVLTTQAGML